ncbi:tyrosine-type recombinase/integrase [Cyanobacteria bacterium FACHB-DQ100]|nr:tyrosine-type recombinase/integrase [Cyanobacteria bacterium FACHB-DQ100]
MPKSSAGTVQVHVVKGRLKLIWTWTRTLGGHGQRYYLALGLPETDTNLKLAKAKATAIEADLHSRQFDPTLKKYTGTARLSAITVVELFEKWVSHKRDVQNVFEDTLIKYRALGNQVAEFFKSKSVNSVDELTAARFRDFLAESLAQSTLRERIGMMKSLWSWGSEKKIIDAENPWRDVHTGIKVAPTQGEKPFTAQELKRIIQGFRVDSEYSYYADFVEFFLSVGARTGEVIALQWKHFNDDLTTVWIGESITVRNVRKATKTNHAGSFPLPPRLSELLWRRRPMDAAPEDLVFPSRRGSNINAKTFYRRAWKVILEKLEIDYRRPYTLRKSFVNTAVYDHKMTIEQVSLITRHDPRTLKESYLNNVSEIQMPDILES